MGSVEFLKLTLNLFVSNGKAACLLSSGGHVLIYVNFSDLPPKLYCPDV